MFGFIKKKTELEKLQEKYEKVLKEAHRLSTIDRSASDQKIVEAEALAERMEQLRLLYI